MAHLEMEFLGIFRARRDGNPLTDFESSKVRALLAYLAVEAQRPHSRERLAALLWPDWPESAARSNLRYALADLRKVISDRTAKPPFLNISREAIQFNIHSEHWLDVAEFSNLSSTTQGTGIERLERAIELYKGEFLEGFSISDAAPWEDWVRLKRQQLQRCYLEALHRLAAVLEECGEHEGALQHAYRLVEVEPLDESAHRQVMCLLAFSGRGGEALAQYEACREVLRAELGAEPSQETEELYQVLLSGELPPAGMETLQPERPPRQVGACPYRGLAVFREQDAQFFFGREDFTRRLHEVHPHNLPVQLTSFVGRERQVADIQGAFLHPVSPTRLLTLTGTGGTGKTRLALQVAAEMIDEFPDGAWFIDLSPLTDPDL
ncbi:MAG: winged helix-turn-helix domain-containing protein, partial [Anaerolineales bacterium]